MSISEIIRTKRAVREFTAQPIPEEAATQILNAGRRAQSSKNSQPWYFIGIRNEDTLAQLAQCGPYAGHIAGANLAIALVSTESNLFDLGQAAAQMQLVAWELGIGSCLAAMWEEDKAKAILNIPAELHFHYVISFGYPLQTQTVSPKPNGRKTLDEVVQWERWK